jgi:hypothetical protein
MRSPSAGRKTKEIARRKKGLPGPGQPERAGYLTRTGRYHLYPTRRASLSPVVRFAARQPDPDDPRKRCRLHGDRWQSEREEQRASGGGKQT